MQAGITADLAQGFVQGLSAGVYCLGHCAVVIGPALGAARDQTTRSSAGALFEFSAGRLVAYLAAGAAAGGAGQVLAADSSTVRQIVSLAFVPLGLLLFAHVLRETESGGAVCGALHAGRKWFRTPLLLGVFSGVAPCPPVWMAAADVLAGPQGDAWARSLRGALHFLAFFAGTTVFLLPLISAGVAARFAPVRRLSRAVAGLAALYFVFTGLEGFAHPEGRTPAVAPAAVEEGDLRYVYPDADSFSAIRAEGPFPHYLAYRNSGLPENPATPARVGVCFVTSEAVRGVSGWAGPIAVLVGLTDEGKITGVKVLPGQNRETPGFIEPLYEQEFDGQFRGKAAWDPLEAGKDVDGVTGATVSVDAVSEGVRLACRRASFELLRLGTSGGSGPGGLLPRGAGTYALLALAVAAGFLYRLKPGYKWRLAALAGAAAILGVWFAHYATGADLVRAVSWNPPGGSSFRAWIVLFSLYAAAGFLLGKFYCGWLCPFGAVQELLFRAMPITRPAVSERADAWLRRARLLILLALPAAAIAASDPGIARYEPLSALFHPRSLTIAAGVLLAVCAAGAVLIERFYCKYLCPIGAVSDFLTRNRLLNRRPGLVCGGCYRAEQGCRFIRENPQFSARKDGMRGDCIC